MVSLGPENDWFYEPREELDIDDDPLYLSSRVDPDGDDDVQNDLPERRSPRHSTCRQLASGVDKP